MNTFKTIILLVFSLMLLSSITLGVAGLFVKDDYTFTVTEKVVKNSKEHSKYLIFGEDKDGHIKVVQNTDSLFKGKFNSSDIYADIKVGKTYHFDVYGFRIPFLSKYENIDSYKEVKK